MAEMGLRNDQTAANLKGKTVLLHTKPDNFHDILSNNTVEQFISGGAKTIVHFTGLDSKRKTGGGPISTLFSNAGKLVDHTSVFVDKLTESLGIQVTKSDGSEVEKAIDALPNGGVLFVDGDSEDVAKKLESLADFQVSTNPSKLAHNLPNKGTIEGRNAAEYIDMSATYLLNKNMQSILEVTNSDKPFAAIVGGSRVSVAYGEIPSSLGQGDVLILGGEMIFAFYKAQGLSIGSTLVEDDQVELAKSILEELNAKGVKVVLPKDVVVVDESNKNAVKVVPASSIPDGWSGLDMAPQTIELISDELNGVKAVTWNGKMGTYREYNHHLQKYTNTLTATQAVMYKMDELDKKGVKTSIIKGLDVDSGPDTKDVSNSGVIYEF